MRSLELRLPFVRFVVSEHASHPAGNTQSILFVVNHEIPIRIRGESVFSY